MPDPEAQESAVIESTPASTEAPEQLPTIGRVVHYVLDNGEHRPALVVKPYSSAATLGVFTDGPEDFGHVDGVAQDGAVVTRPSVVYSSACEPGTWHWPERV